LTLLILDRIVWKRLEGAVISAMIALKKTANIL
jgi:hypothetical protein